MGEYVKRALVAAFAGWIGIDVYMSAVYIAFHSSPLRLFQWDASNAFGKAAYAGGYGSAALGLLFDYAVSLAWALIAAYAVQRIAWARAHAVLFGLLFGAAVMYVMLWLVVPLGHAQQAPKTPLNMAIILAGHMLFFGLPVVLAVRGRLQSASTGSASFDTSG